MVSCFGEGAWTEFVGFANFILLRQGGQPIMDKFEDLSFSFECHLLYGGMEGIKIDGLHDVGWQIMFVGEVLMKEV